MSELMMEVQALRKENAEIKTMLHDLTVLVMKDKIDTTWVDEEEAAKSVGLTPEWFRRKVKKGEYPFSEISYRNSNGRNWQYSRKGLIKYKSLTSNQ